MTTIPNEKEIRERYKSLTLFLIEKNISITTMESITSGMIASFITDTEGASAVFRGAFITYSNEAKIRFGVPKETIDTYSVYSEETAAAMAEACARVYSADVGIGVTGTAGNIDPMNPEASEPGMVYYSINYRGVVHTFKKRIDSQKSRFEYKLAIADEIYKTLTKII